MYRMFESFDADLNDRWTRYGVRGEGKFLTRSRGRVAQLTAGEKRGSEVGKACIIHEFPYVFSRGDSLDVAASLVVPPLSRGRISLIDIECKYCGVAAQPGIRLFVDTDRSIYLERGKLGIASSFRQTRGPWVPVDTWFDLRWSIQFSPEQDGTSDVWIDGNHVLSARGANFPDQRIARSHGISLLAEQYDRIQIGLTANSQPRPVSILLDDVEIVADFAAKNPVRSGD